jgi:hypothetical protein
LGGLLVERLASERGDKSIEVPTRSCVGSDVAEPGSTGESWAEFQRVSVEPIQSALARRVQLEHGWIGQLAQDRAPKPIGRDL